MANWNEKFEAIRRWIDDEPKDAIPEGIEKAQKMKSESEIFLQKLVDAVDAVLKREITRIPSINKAYIPEKFIVFLSEEADKNLRQDKRKIFEKGLNAIVLERAKEMIGNLELTSKKIDVSISVNGVLEDDEIEVRAVSEDINKTIEKIEEIKKNKSNDTIEDVGTIEDFDTNFGILYRAEIWQLGRKLNEFPIILRKNTIGRDDEEKIANLRLPTDNRKISRIHAEISLEENGDLWVTALHKNPTIVSGQVIRSGEKTKLGANGEIQIYDFTLRLKFT